MYFLQRLVNYLMNQVDKAAPVQPIDNISNYPVLSKVITYFLGYMRKQTARENILNKSKKYIRGKSTFIMSPPFHFLPKINLLRFRHILLFTNTREQKYFTYVSARQRSSTQTA